MLSKAGWSVDQNVYYIDKDEQKGRELDIHAYKSFHHTTTKPEVTCYIQLCIEVKKTTDPFIFFSNRAKKYEYGSGYSLFNWKNKVSNKVLSYKDIEKFRPFAAPSLIARSYCSFKDGKTQQIQGGILSAVKGAFHYKEECNETYSDYSRDICFFLPVLIVDGPLYECYFEDGSNELTAEPEDTLVYMQNYLSSNYGSISSRVTVITPSALPAYLKACTDWGAHMHSVMIENRDAFKPEGKP